ncbi:MULTISPECIES: ATP-binding protein [Carboxydocella]|uniref:ATP-binding protein n=1 Tax=Carboxydocella TaxID=178898 RepID=UPI0009998E12|nr:MULTISPECIES: ATP-binding protein [Carboxydocella]
MQRIGEILFPGTSSDSTQEALIENVPLSQAAELGAKVPDIKNEICQFCQAELEPVGMFLRVFGPRWYYRGHARCNCKDAQEYWRKYEEEQKKEMLRRAQEEKERAYQEKIARLLKESKLGERFMTRKFENFQVTTKNKQAYEIALKYAKEFEKYKKQGLGLIFTGSYGTGKTHLAAAICHELILQGYQPIFGTMINLLEKIKATYDDDYARENEEQVINKYINCDLLIIDDLGKERPTEWAVEKLYYIINSRYEKNKPILITSNYDIEKLTARLTVKDNLETAEAITSRIFEMCRGVHMNYEDYRKIV